LQLPSAQARGTGYSSNMQPLPEAGAESMSLNLGDTLFQVA